jgi:membrane fusion protein (multidrug efflux system)
LNEVTKGGAVRATADPFPGEVFSGRITLVGQSVDPGTRTFLVEAELPNRDGRLRPGLFARVELDLAGSGKAASHAKTR